MATFLTTTTSKGAGHYVGETKKQLRDGECKKALLGLKAASVVKLKVR